MEDAVCDRLDKMRLTAEEEETMAISDDGRLDAIESSTLSLIGKFLTCKSFNKVAAKNTIRRAWGLNESLQILEVGPNLFQFKFLSEFDLDRILRGGPWPFDNQLLLLQRWRRGMTVEEYNAEFKIAQTRLDAQMRKQPNGDTWKPPPTETYKLNFDAAIFSDSGRTGYGAIIRIEKGEVTAAMTASGPMVHTIDEAEFLACQRAMEFAVDARFLRMIIEGDNINVIHAISSSLENKSPFGSIVDDIRHLMWGLQWFSVSCIRRGGNRVAHALAQYARSTLDEDVYWMEDSPPPALAALLHDISLI